jgi:hypothetical protein
VNAACTSANTKAKRGGGQIEVDNRAQKRDELRQRWCRGSPGSLSAGLFLLFRFFFFFFFFPFPFCVQAWLCAFAAVGRENHIKKRKSKSKSNDMQIQRESNHYKKNFLSG